MIAVRLRNIHGEQGLGITDLLLVMFVVLKIANLIDWSWWWVASPIWLPIAIQIFLGALS